MEDLENDRKIAIRTVKSKYIEKQVTSYMNRPDVGKGGVTPINKARYYNEAAAKFAKDFDLPESVKRREYNKQRI